MQMKNSNIPWIGEIPSDWEVCRLKNYAKICNGQDYKDVYSEDGTYPVIGSGGKFSTASIFMYDRESVLLGRKGTVDKPLYINFPFWTVDTMYYTEILNIAYPKFFYYLCTTIDFQFYQYGSAIPSMTQRDLNNVIFPLPPLKTQQKIADFLDVKCSKIDSTIEQEKKQIVKLKEYRQSLITEAVTKGLNPNMPMKDSGIEWIGEIPQGWEVNKLKKLGKIKGRIGFKGYTVADLVDEDSSGNAIVLGGTNVMKGGYINYDKLTYLSEFKYLESPEIMLKGNEILITKVGAGTGENALYHFHSERVTINPNVMIFVPEKIIPSYANYYLLSAYFKSEVFIESNKSGAQPAINQEFIKNLSIPLPPLEEQKQIADYLDTKTAQLDNAIAKKETLIAKLQEYKKSLIFEAVTGKI